MKDPACLPLSHLDYVVGERIGEFWVYIDVQLGEIMGRDDYGDDALSFAVGLRR